ncbi:MAG TPA: efflux RND transporter permease subunit [Deinococcales bacterium]|nr:efflux RND transporter permease subunit [Deinococcales bacterium]
MQSLIRYALRNSAVMVLVTLLVAVAGLLAARGLKQELLPDIKFPVITVITPFPLAGPEVVEAQVTRPLEGALRVLNGVERVTSTSSANVSVVVLEFDFGVNLPEAEARAQAAAARVRASLPSGAQEPTVAAVRFSDSPVLRLAVTGGNVEQLRQRVEGRVLPALQGIGGVSRVDLTGAPPLHVRVTLDPARLASNGLDAGAVSQTLSASTLAFPVGQVRDGELNLPVQVDSAAKAVADLAGLVVGVSGGAAGGPAVGAGRPGAAGGLPAGLTGEGGGVPAAAAGAPAPARPRPVLLSQVADVALTAAPATSLTRLDGSTAVGLTVFKSQEANTLSVTRAVRDALPDLEKEAGGSFTVLADQGEPIAKSVRGLLSEGGLGGLFAVLVVLVFLRDLRTTLVTAVSIPLSLLVALLLLQWQGLSLNVLTLGGLTIAIGRVIDDAIVVIENIHRRMAGGEDRHEAAVVGAGEVAAPVTASTITTVAVFLPLAFVGGLAGEFFRPLALAVTWSILASLVVAFTVVPLLAGLVVRAGLHRRASETSILERFYRPTIEWVTGHKAVTVGLSVLALAAAGALASQLPTNFVGGGEPTSAEVSLKVPAGTTLAAADAEARKLEARLAALKADGVAASYLTIVGGADNAFALAFGAGSGAAVSVTVLPGEGTSVEELRARLAEDLSGVATGDLSVTAGQGGGGFSNNVEVRVQADDPAVLRQASAAVATAMRGVEEVRNVKSSLSDVQDELSVRFDAPRAYAAGIVPAVAAGGLRTALSGSTATSLQIGERRLDVVVAYPEGTYDTAEELAAFPLRSAAGVTVPLSSVAVVERAPAPSSIVRVDGRRTATVSAEPSGENVGAASSAIRAAVEAAALPDGARWELAGVTAQQAESFRSLGVAILAAVALVYVVMVATFQSLLTPLLLLASIPLVAVGAFPLLFLTGTPIGLPVFFGFLLLVGIVVTNAIVLIDLVERLRERGMSPREAVIEGGARRVRPIVMTALTTILGLAPLAAGLSEGGGIVGKPLAVTVIGGLASSTLLTLVVVPALYLAAFGRRRGRAVARAAAAD